MQTLAGYNNEGLWSLWLGVLCGKPSAPVCIINTIQASSKRGRTLVACQASGQLVCLDDNTGGPRDVPSRETELVLRPLLVCLESTLEEHFLSSAVTPLRS